MDRIVEVKVNGSHVTKDSQYAGVQGEVNATWLRIEFDDGWDGFTKTITWWDAKGENPTSRVLTANALEDIKASTRIYLTPVVPEALAIWGQCMFAIDGYTNGKRQRSAYTRMVVKPRGNGEDVTIEELTPSQIEQIQAQIEQLLEQISKLGQGGGSSSGGSSGDGSVGDGEGNFSELTQRVDGIETRVRDAEGNLSTLTQKAASIESSVSNAKGDISRLTQRATGIESSVKDNKGNISTLQQIASRLSSRLTDSEGRYSELVQLVDELRSVMEDPNGDYSSVIQRVNQLEALIGNGDGDVSSITQRVDQIELQVEANKGDVASLYVKADEIEASVKNNDGDISTLTQRANSIESRVSDNEENCTSIRQSVDSIKLSVSDPIVGSNGSYVSLELLVGGVTQSLGMVKIDGNVDISGQLSAEALYAIMGDIAMLTVNSLSTSRRIPLYLARDKTDDNYIRIEGRDLALMRAWTDGSTEQARDPNGALLYWTTDVSDATLGDDGYPYIDGSRVFTTTEETDYPVYVYVYEEGYRLRITFDEANSFGPRMIWGEGDGTSSGKGRGYLEKLGLSFDIYNLGSDGVKRGVFMGNEYVDIVGERLPTKMVSSGNTLTVTYQGGITRTFTFTESNGTVTAVSFDGHTVALEGF